MSLQVVVGNMAEEVQRAPLRILHHMVDIWTDTGSQRKFVAVHLAYVNSNFELRDACVETYVFVFSISFCYCFDIGRARA